MSFEKYSKDDLFFYGQIPDCIIQISESHKTDINSKQRKTALARRAA